MSKGKTHYGKLLFTSPCSVKGCPPTMIRVSEFCTRFNYSRKQLLTLMRDRHVLAMHFKNLLLVTPNICSYLWTKEVLIEFWGKDYLDKIN